MTRERKGAAVLVIRVCGGVEVEADGRLLPPALLAGRQGRLVLAYLACSRHRAVPREELAELLWPGDLPASWTSSLHAVISRLRKLFVEAGLDGTAALASAGGAYRLVLPDDAEVDWEVATAAVADAEQAVAAGDGGTAIEAGSRAATIAGRGFLADDGEWVDDQRDLILDVSVRAALAIAEGHLLDGSPVRAVEAAREALGRDPFREAAFRVLMRTLAAAGERAEALRVWERCRTTLVDELGVDPSPETEAVYLAVLEGGDRPEPAPQPPVASALPSGVVTFLLTDIVGSTELWERNTAAMATALERHDQLVAEVVAAHGGTLLKSKLEGDATVSVFARATAGALAALALRDALEAEPWPEGAAPSLRMAMHTGEAFERDGDYFGPALNRAARLRGLAGAGQVLLSQAVAELVRDHLPEGVALADRGHRDLRGLSRGENVYELAPLDELDGPLAAPSALERPPLPAPLASPGPFVGRGGELARLATVWERASQGEPQALLLAGEPGVGKSRLAAECARAAHAAGGVVLYGRCDEELGAPLQPFIEALRALVPALGTSRLRAVRGIDELSRLVPELRDLLPDAAPTQRADPDSERYALFDATTELLCAASAEAPTLVVLDDLHWAGKTTLSLLRHLLRNAKDARLLVLGTYRDTELARTHPLAALLADLRRDGAADKLTLSGLAPDDVAAYLRAVGNPDRALGRELAEVTSGNPFFLIEALRHVEEVGGRWEPGSLPEGVREATGRRLSQLSDATNDALSVAAVAGTTFDLALVERVCDVDVLDALGEAVQAGLVIEEPGAPGQFRFAHALVRQVLLAELVTIKRLRLHRTIAELLEAEPGPDPDAHLTDLAHHWFECALTGGGEKAVDACRRAGDRARERLAYEEAGDLYGMAIQALDAVDHVEEDELATLHLARCDALLSAGDVAGARGAIDALGQAARGSSRLQAWHITYAGQLAVLAEPDRLDEIVASIADAAAAMHAVGDLTGEATARYVHALALERLGRIGAAQRALDEALAAARTAEDRRLADAILAEVPPAALWGPSPVTRASGNCLDVVRVLRITDGAPAVESVALRCQAVLEALRGRMDAARRMVSSSHRMVDQLGLVHRRLETEVSAGFIELLDREAEAAEGHLRPAYEELRDRGIGGEAAQAAALLGRALLMQGRDDEAEAVAQEAEQLAGADLKAAIAWRDVRAEAAARRGDTALALDLAREAVELATATDALLLVADARLALATVLRASGDVAAAQAEAARALEACDAKGATALAAGTRARAGGAEAATATMRPLPGSSHVATLLDNAAVRFERRLGELWEQGDWDAVAAHVGTSGDAADVRPLFRAEMSADVAERTVHQIFEAGASRSTRPLALRGDRLGLFELTWANTEPELEVVTLSLLELGEQGEVRHAVVFEPDDLGKALADLDRRYAEGEAADHAGIVETCTGMVAAMNARDWGRALAALTEDCVVRDHRTRTRASATQTADEWAASWDDVASVWGDAGVQLVHLPRLSATAGLSLLKMTGEGVATHGPSERWWIHVYEHDGSRITGVDIYEEDRYADALARFEELTTSTEDFFANPAVRALRRSTAALNRGDYDGALACFAGATTLQDHRSLVGIDVEHRGALTETMRFIIEGEGTIVEEVLATRGDRLCLTRSSWEGAPGRIDLLQITQLDDDDRIEHVHWFDPDALDAAYDELDRLHVASGARDGTAFIGAVNARDWEGVAASIAPDCVIVDQRPARLGRIEGRDQIVDFYRSTVELTPDLRAIVHQAKLVGTVAVAPITMSGEIDGARFEVQTIVVLDHDDEGRIRYTEFFDGDDLPGAIARFHELVAEGRRAERFDNTAVRVARRMVAAMNRGDVPEALALLAPDPRVEDRRALVGLLVDDELLLPNLQFVFESGGTVDTEVLATRGDRLCLTRHRWDTGDAEIEILHVGQTDSEGRYAVAIWFDPDALDAAYAELDRLYAAGEAAEHAATLTTITRTIAALNARDWATARTGLRDDFRVRNHRSVRTDATELSADEWAATWPLAAEVWGDAVVRIVHVLRLSATGGVFVIRMATEGSEGRGPAERWWIQIFEHDGTLTTALEIFEDDQLEAALARYEELTAAPSDGCHERFVNAAVRVGRVITQAMNDHDLDATMACWAADATFEDRRALFRSGGGTDGVREAFSFLYELGGSYHNEVLATRGETLSLNRMTWESDDGAEAQLLWTGIVGDEDLLVHVTWHDADDLRGAYDELDARYVALGGHDVGAIGRASAAQDWDSLLAQLAPGFEIVDHRVLGLLGTDLQGYLRDFQVGADLAPDVRIEVHHVLAANEHAVHSLCGSFGTRDGGEFEIPLVFVGGITPAEQWWVWHIYDDTQMAEARARYEELSAGPAEDPFTNTALRTRHALTAALQGTDWERTRALIADDFVGADRRRVSLVEGLGPDESFRPFQDLDELEALDTTLIATRGDRLALISFTIRLVDRSAGEAHADVLQVFEVDDAGRCSAVVVYDNDDLDGAYDELDARYVALGGPDLGTFRRAHAARDWDALAALLAPDFEAVDHRMVGTSDGDAASHLRDMESLVDLSSDVRLEVRHVLGSSRLAVYGLGRGRGTREGGAFERPTILVAGLTADGRSWIWEYFDPEDLDRARARYEELADPTVVHPNRADRTMTALGEAFVRGDWEDIEALCAEDMVFEDHRHHLRGGRELFLQSAQVMSEQEAKPIARDLLATPGDRLCLGRRLLGAGDGTWDAEHYVVAEVDDDGILTAYLTFARTDRAVAAKELNRRFGALIGSPPDVVTVVDAINDHDVDAVRTAFGEQCRFEDHRRGHAGAIKTTDDYAASLQAALDLTNDLVMEPARMFAMGRRGHVALTRRSGTNPDGGPFEVLFLTVSRWDEQRFTVVSLYEVDDLDAALVRFAELMGEAPA